MTNFMSLLTCFAEKTSENEAVYRFESAVEPSDRVDLLDDSMFDDSAAKRPKNNMYVFFLINIESIGNFEMSVSMKQNFCLCN